MREVYAQVNIGSAFPPAKVFETPAGLLSGFINPVLLIAGIIFFVLVIIAGFNLISAAGNTDPHAQEKWRQVLTSGIVGLLIIFAAYWILQIINFVTGGSLSTLLGT
jgi:hypothetical protein